MRLLRLWRVNPTTVLPVGSSNSALRACRNRAEDGEWVASDCTSCFYDRCAQATPYRAIGATAQGRGAWEDRDLVFCDLHGGYLNSRYLLKMFDRLLESAELPHMHFHDLRHSAALILLSMGGNAKVIQELLGHSEMSITLGTYSHLLPTMQEEAMGKWDDVFGDGDDDEMGDERG